jgi:dTDP-4-dehydrorhamnose reductase
MKVLLTGASGLVGQAALRAALARGHEVMAVGQNRLPPLPAMAAAQERAHAVQADLTDDAALERLVFDYYPEAIINAAAASSPAAVEADAAGAEKINVGLPRRLAQLANHMSTRFLQISTDMVFDGEGGPYRSTDVPMPRTLYGQMKLMAEKEVLRFGGDFVVVLRITLVNGNSPSGRRSLHEKLFHAWAVGQVTPLYTDEMRQPVGAENVGDVLTELLERPNLHGLFHWAGPDVLSRYEIGRAVAEHFGLPEHLIRAASLAEEAGAEARPHRLELVLPPLLGKLKAKPTPFAEQLEELRVPAECAEWHRQASKQAGNGQSAAGEAAPKRLVRGRDF